MNLGRRDAAAARRDRVRPAHRRPLRGAARRGHRHRRPRRSSTATTEPPWPCCGRDLTCRRMSLYRQAGRASGRTLVIAAVVALLVGLVGRLRDRPRERAGAHARRRGGRPAGEARPGPRGHRAERDRVPQAVRDGRVVAPTEYGAAKADVSAGGCRRGVARGPPGSGPRPRRAARPVPRRAAARPRPPGRSRDGPAACRGRERATARRDRGRLRLLNVDGGTLAAAPSAAAGPRQWTWIGPSSSPGPTRRG